MLLVKEIQVVPQTASNDTLPKMGVSPLSSMIATANYTCNKKWDILNYTRGSVLKGTNQAAFMSWASESQRIWYPCGLRVAYWGDEPHLSAAVCWTHPTYTLAHLRESDRPLAQGGGLRPSHFFLSRCPPLAAMSPCPLCPTLEGNTYSYPGNTRLYTQYILSLWASVFLHFPDWSDEFLA